MKLKFKINKSELSDLLYGKRLTQKQIAQTHSVSRGSVQRAMKRFDLQCLEDWQRRYPEKLSCFQKEVLYGTLLGDDNLYRYATSNYSYLNVCHSLKFKNYVATKLKVFQAFSNYDKPIIRRRKDGTKRCVFMSGGHPDFEKIRKDYYEGTIKHVRRRHLDRLTAMSLGFWFSDDGSRCKNRGLAIHTNCFPLKEVEMICSYFENKFDFRCWPQKRAPKQWVVFFSNQTSFDYAELILPWVHPDARYKLESIYTKNPQRLHASPYKVTEILNTEDIVRPTWRHVEPSLKVS